MDITASLAYWPQQQTSAGTLKQSGLEIALEGYAAVVTVVSSYDDGDHHRSLLLYHHPHLGCWPLIRLAAWMNVRYRSYGQTSLF